MISQESEQFYIESVSYRYSLNNHTKSLLNLKPNKCIISDMYTNEEINKIFFTFHIPDSPIFKREKHIIQDSQRGLLYGWKLDNDGKTDIHNWEEEKFIISTNLSEVIIMPSFIFKKLNSKDFNKNDYILFDQLVLQIEIDNVSKELNILEKEIFKLVDIILQIVSFLQGEFSNWQYLKSTLLSENGNIPILIKETFRKSKIERMKREDIRHYYKYSESYQQIIPKLVVQYQKLNDNDIIIFSTVLRRFLVASVHDKLDTQIIYWISCLDLMIKWSKVRGRSFTKKLVKACVKNNIDYKDLFSYLTKENINKGVKLKIYEIRNEMIHDGEYLSDYKTAISEMAKVRALAERFIVKILDVDYRGTGIGLEHKR